MGLNMRARLITAAIIALATGCTRETDTATNSGKGWLDSAASAVFSVSSNEWTLKTTNFDEDVLTASRTYEFGDRNTAFYVEITCNTAPPDKGNPFQFMSSGGELVVQSFVGDVSAPAPESAFIVSEFGADRFVQGRTKNLKTGESAGLFVPTPTTAIKPFSSMPSPASGGRCRWSSS